MTHNLPKSNQLLAVTLQQTSRLLCRCLYKLSNKTAKQRERKVTTMNIKLLTRMLEEQSRHDVIHVVQLEITGFDESTGNMLTVVPMTSFLEHSRAFFYFWNILFKLCLHS